MTVAFMDATVFVEMFFHANFMVLVAVGIAYLLGFFPAFLVIPLLPYLLEVKLKQFPFVFAEVVIFPDDRFKPVNRFGSIVEAVCYWHPVFQRGFYVAYYQVIRGFAIGHELRLVVVLTVSVYRNLKIRLKLERYLQQFFTNPVCQQHSVGGETQGHVYATFQAAF